VSASSREEFSLWTGTTSARLRPLHLGGVVGDAVVDEVGGAVEDAAGRAVGDVAGANAASPKAAIAALCILHGTRTHLRIPLAV
jgi:hypothetical protein